MGSALQAGVKTYNVAVVGATGAVGIEMIRMLELRKFPREESSPSLASERSEGIPVQFKGHPISVEVLRPESIKNIDIAIFSAGATVFETVRPLVR